MPLGTLDRTPPPFFRQGPSALSKLVFFSALAVFLMVADTRFQVMQPLRTALAVLLLPVQRVLAVPVQAWHGGADYLLGLDTALAAERKAQQRLSEVAERAHRADQLAQENARLRDLLGLRPALQVEALSAEVMYEAADAFTRKVFIDRGTQHGLVPGSPVINADGVLGQVTQAYPLSAEVTLLADKDAAIPVLNTRTQQRSAAFGTGGGDGAGGASMELRFVTSNADVQIGDLLHTSGVDGVYPPGLPVARVSTVERGAGSGFARILLTPMAPADGVRHVLVLQPLTAQLPPRPAAGDEADAPAERQLATPPRRSASAP